MAEATPNTQISPRDKASDRSEDMSATGDPDSLATAENSGSVCDDVTRNENAGDVTKSDRADEVAKSEYVARSLSADDATRSDSDDDATRSHFTDDRPDFAQNVEPGSLTTGRERANRTDRSHLSSEAHQSRDLTQAPIAALRHPSGPGLANPQPEAQERLRTAESPVSGPPPAIPHPHPPPSSSPGRRNYATFPASPTEAAQSPRSGAYSSSRGGASRDTFDFEPTTGVITSTSEVPTQHLPDGLRFILTHVVPEDVQFSRVPYNPRDDAATPHDVIKASDEDMAVMYRRRRRRRRRPQREASCDADLMPRATKGTVGGARPPAKVIHSRAIPIVPPHVGRQISRDRPPSITQLPRERRVSGSTSGASRPPGGDERPRLPGDGEPGDEGESSSSSEDEDDVAVVPMQSLRNSTSSQKAILAVLAINDMLASMALSILAPFFPKEARNKNISEAVSGWVFGVFALVQCLTSPLIGKMLPKVGARFLCQAGLFFTGGCTVLFGTLQYLPEENGPLLFISFCFLLRIMMAVGSAATNTASFAIAAHTFPDNPAVIFGLLETAVGFGLMMGPALGGVLYEVGGFVAPFVAVGSMMIISVPFCLCILPAESQDPGDQSSGSISDFLRVPAISITALAAFVACLAWVMPDPTLEPHLDKQFHLTPTVIGLIFLVMSACYAVCSPIWGFVADGMPDSAPMMVVGFMGTAVGFLLLGPSPLLGLGEHFSPLWLNITSLIVIGVMVSLALVPTYDKILDAAEKAGMAENLGNYSMMAGIWNASYSFGEFVGPVLAGWMTGVVGFAWTMTAAAGLCVFMALVMLILYLYERKFGPTGVRKKPALVGPATTTPPTDLTSDERTPLLASRTIPA